MTREPDHRRMRRASVRPTPLRSQQTYRRDTTGRPDRICCYRGGRGPPPCRGDDTVGQMSASMGESPFSSLTGRAVSAGPGHTSGDALGRPAILIVGPGCWSSAHLVLNESGRPAPGVIISAEWPDSLGHNPIKGGILLVRLPPQTVAELQSVINSDPAILLTVDIHRRDVRARGRLVGRFEMPPFWCDRLPDGMAGRLLIAQRLLGSADLSGGDRIRLQRRFAAICDAMKAPGADGGRIARRLDRLLADVAARSRAGLS
jgi:hypothetical protein